MSGRSCSPSTAATRRPTSRCSARDGALLALARGPLSSPHHVGLEGCLDVLETLLAQARASGGAATAASPSPACSWPAPTSRPRSARCRRPSTRAAGPRARPVANDTFAILRAGTERGWGVAVVCGAGINCVGVAPDGRDGPLPGARRDHGRLGRRLRRRDGGAARRRAQRGRPRAGDAPAARGARALRARHGPRGLARRSTPAGSPQRRVLELAPVVFDAGGRRRGRGDDRRPPRRRDRRLRARRARAAAARRRRPSRSCSAAASCARPTAACSPRSPPAWPTVGPSIVARVVPDPPIVGAALLGLDELGAAPPPASARAAS